MSIMMIQSETVSSVEKYLDKYGWPTLILIGLLGLLRLGWPFMRAYIVGLQKATEDAFTLMRERLAAAEERAEKSHTGFLAALDAQRLAHESSMKIQSDTHSHIAEINAKNCEGTLLEINRQIGEQTGAIRDLRDGIRALTDQLNVVHK